MLKARLIPVIITKGDLVVQSFNFSKYLPIGDVKTAIEFFVKWDVDEIIIIDIDASKEMRSPNLSLIEWAASDCFVPLTVGGGIKSINDIRDLLNAGADKICINSITRENQSFISESSAIFGSQCITVSLDAKLETNKYFVFDYLNSKPTNISVIDHANEIESMGAGEIFLNSVDRDGSRIGYDIDLLKLVSETLSIPVIACGGVGKSSDLPRGIIDGKCQAVAAANIFQHTEHSTIAAKSFLYNSGVPIRLSSEVKYENFSFDKMGRPY